MRGFRGTRAAQNQMAFRQGQRNDHTRFQSIKGGLDDAQAQNQRQQRPELPDWLKVPEKVLAEQRSEMTPKERPQLKLVVNNKERMATPSAAKPALKAMPTKPVAAKAAKPVAKAAKAPAKRKPAAKPKGKASSRSPSARRKAA